MKNPHPVNITDCKPFLKWAGGKSQLILEIEKKLPPEINKWDSFNFIESFIGSGAVLFYMLKNFKNLRKAVINDINPDLTKAYLTIKSNPRKLIKKLSKIEKKYYDLSTLEEKKEMFLEKRDRFNTRKLNDIENTSLLIFINRTCFNGLYRVNSKGGFNVPFGKYSTPRICDEKTILADSEVLQKVEILNGDFEQTLKYTGKNTLFYLDPPYKPISETSQFTSYSIDKFGDTDQERLKKFCDSIHTGGSLYILSNSDLKNTDSSNNYFDSLYSEYVITRVKAKRNINANGNNRGEISELLITNYHQNNNFSFV